MGFKNKPKLILFRLPTISLKKFGKKWPPSKGRSHWPSYDTRHCPMAWYTTTPSLVTLHQIVLMICCGQNFLLKIWKQNGLSKSRSQWPRYDTWHCPMSWHTKHQVWWFCIN